MLEVIVFIDAVGTDKGVPVIAKALLSMLAYVYVDAYK